jgi:hypothetical protein
MAIGFSSGRRTAEVAKKIEPADNLPACNRGRQTAEKSSNGARPEPTREGDVRPPNVVKVWASPQFLIRETNPFRGTAVLTLSCNDRQLAYANSGSAIIDSRQAKRWRCRPSKRT